ncbi:uncharacterized protein [Narcine bancroftii]|uniref:uncharacterized protein isoform X2 n=1 Tax=Narcine bancroftii TaxID=1343680 RepID=UPI003831C730
MSTRGMEGRGRRHWKSSGIMDNTIKFQMTMSKKYKNYSEDCLTICLKYLLFVYNIIFWVAGAVVLVIGSWTLSEKKDYLSLLPSSTFVVSAGILVFTGCLVTISGFLGCCAIVREQKSALVTYFSSLLLIFLVELIAGALACVYYQMLSEELKQHLNKTMVENYGKPGEGSVTDSIDRLQQDEAAPMSSYLYHSLRTTLGQLPGLIGTQQLITCFSLPALTQMHLGDHFQLIIKANLDVMRWLGLSVLNKSDQEFKCCGSNSLSDWQYSVYINSPGSGNRLVPDSCCKTVTEACGQRDHPSNVYKVESCQRTPARFSKDHLVQQEFQKCSMASGCLCCLKYLMFVFNLVFWVFISADVRNMIEDATVHLLCGCGLLGVGIWLSATQGSFATLAPSLPYLSAANLVIAIGTTIMVVGFLGCLGAIKENKCLLLSFFIILVTIFFMELILVILFFVYRTEVGEYVRRDLKRGLMLYDSEGNVGLTNAWNIIQNEYECCGVDNATDWDSLMGGNFVPDSCCQEYSQKCGLHDPSKWFANGCYDKIAAFIEQRSVVLGSVAMSVVVIQILGMVFSMILFHQISRGGKKYKA